MCRAGPRFGIDHDSLRCSAENRARRLSNTLMSGFPKTLVLACHPQTLCAAVRRVAATLWKSNSGALGLTYALEGDLARLRIPLQGPARRGDKLWQHACFEVFIGVAGSKEYHEFNFAPSGEWAAYAFRRYRVGAPLAQAVDPHILVRAGEHRLELDAVVPFLSLPTAKPHERLRVGISAVVEDETGLLSYWALRHPPGRPDFHHPDAFALELEPF